MHLIPNLPAEIAIVPLFQSAVTRPTLSLLMVVFKCHLKYHLRCPIIQSTRDVRQYNCSQLLITISLPFFPSANDYTAANRSRTIERLVGGYLQYPNNNNKYNPPPPRRTSTSSFVPPTRTATADEDLEVVVNAEEEDNGALSSTPSSYWQWTTPPSRKTTTSEEDIDSPSSTSVENIFAKTTTLFAAASSTEEEATTTFAPHLPTEKARITTTTRRSPPTTTQPRVVTTRQQQHYFNIRQNSNKPSISPSSSSVAATSSPVISAGANRPHSSSSPPSPIGSKLNTKIYFKRKNETKSSTDTIKVPESSVISSNSLSSSASQIKIITTSRPKDRGTLPPPTKSHYLTDSLEDAALLEIDQQLDNWDNGLLRASAGAGLEGGSSAAGVSSSAKPESKKTLSDQVAEGKYGLIQTELFEKPVKRPGVLSYDKNPEVPKDTMKNYGGLEDEEIWLAEDHLLVLKGGALSTGESDWVPIDAYEAPQRPVKIPNNPEVPPPFPVQLEENGPVQFIGNHPGSFFGPFPNGPVPAPYPGGSPYPPQAGGPGFNPPNLSPWPGSVQNFTTDNGYNYPSPPSSASPGQDPFLNYGPPGYPPGNPFGPGGPPPPPFINGSLENVNNTADYPDEDDPSLYYPPPYSFVYKSNYSNAVPPGPLVPGIVLPPPPNFFTRLEGSLSQSHSKGNRTALRKRPPNRMPIVRPHKIPTAGGDSPKITKLTTTNLPPTIRRPTTNLPPTTSTTTTGRTTIPTRLVNHQQNVYNPKYKDQENIVINYEPPQLPPQLLANLKPLNNRPVSVEYDDHYQNTVEPPPAIKSVTQLKKVNDPLIKFIGGNGGGGGGGKVNANSNPIYFEYFDAQKGAQKYRTSTPGPAYIPVTRLESTTFDYDKFLYVTPQPEIRPNGEPPQLTIHTQPDIIYQRLPADPLKSNFNHEVETIRQTLQYYQAQPQLIPLQPAIAQPHDVELDNNFQNQVQRTPKAKPVYQYSFEATGGNDAGGGTGNGIIGSTSPKYASTVGGGILDTTPFKPMVQYSAPLGSQADKDGFKPFPPSASYFSTTPNAIPVTTVRPTKTRSKLLPVHQQQPGIIRQQQQQQQQFNLNGDHLYNVQFGSGSGSGYLRNAKPGSSYSGYYYEPSQQQQQQQQKPPQQQHHTAVDPYMQQIAALRQKLRHHSTFHEFYQHPNYNHFNGSSSLRFYPGPGPQLPRPNSRFTDNHNYNHRLEQQQQQYQNLLAPQSQNTQYYSRIQTHPQTAHQQQQQSPYLSLEKDILVNYKYPLPAGNPDAETLPAEFLEDHRQSNGGGQRPNYFGQPHPHFQYNPQQQQNSQQQFYQYRLPGDQAHVYFLPSSPSQEKRTRMAKSIEDGGGGGGGGGAESEKDIKRRRRRK